MSFDPFPPVTYYARRNIASTSGGYWLSSSDETYHPDSLANEVLGVNAACEYCGRVGRANEDCRGCGSQIKQRTVIHSYGDYPLAST